MKLGFTIRQIRQRKILPWLIGLAALSVAVATRYILGTRLSGLPFITLFPAIVIAALFGGRAVGVTVLGLSIVAAWFLFVPPFWSFRFERSTDMAALVIYAISGSVVLFCVDLLNRATDEAFRLRERTVTLFKELQHRVANNLTFVSAILSLQSRSLDPDSEAVRALTVARDRLFTMGQLHRHLYDPGIVDQPAGSALAFICDDLVQSSGLHVTCSVDADATRLEQDQLITVALIVSELVTNSLKHAFSGRDVGYIAIEVKTVGIQCVVRVTDDGRGMSASAQKSTGLGRSIVESLTRQLKATMTTENNGGTIVSLTFPVRRAASLT